MLLIELNKALMEGKEDFIADKQGENLKQAFESNNDMAFVEATVGTQPDAFILLKDKYEENPGLFIIKYLKRADPTNTKYLQWLANQYIGKNFRLEDLPRVRTALATFHQYKAQFPRRDISQYKTLNALEDVIMTLRPKDKKSKKQEKQADKLKGADLVMKGADGMIIKLKTHNAACHYGKNTKWCTAGYVSATFNMYNKQGPIFVFLANDGTKYQFHYESGQFMDARDKQIDKDNVRAEYPTVDKFFRTMETIKQTDTNYYSLALQDVTTLQEIRAQSSSYDDFIQRWKNSPDITVADPKMFTEAMEMLMKRVDLRRNFSYKTDINSLDDLLREMDFKQFRAVFTVSLYQWMTHNGTTLKRGHEVSDNLKRSAGIAYKLKDMVDNSERIRMYPVNGKHDYYKIFDTDIDAIAKSFVRS